MNGKTYFLTSDESYKSASNDMKIQLSILITSLFLFLRLFLIVLFQLLYQFQSAKARQTTSMYYLHEGFSALLEVRPPLRLGTFLVPVDNGLR